MKTHDLAKALTQLGRLLRALPNQELSELESLRTAAPSEVKTVGINLTVLASLSKYGRSHWEEIIREFDLPIQIRPRDASRDIMGKILSYLADNDSERERVARQARDPDTEPSELSAALKFLLSND